MCDTSMIAEVESQVEQGKEGEKISNHGLDGMQERGQRGHEGHARFMAMPAKGMHASQYI